jgi:hypothetical protein
MNDVEELLKDGIDRLTTDARVPAWMAARVRQRHHRRQVATRTTAAVAGTAAASAFAVFVAAGPGGPAHTQYSPGSASGAASKPQTTPAQTVAEVIGNTERAISTNDLIMESTSNGRVYSLSGPPGHQTYTVMREVGWSYHNLELGELFSGPAGFGAGQPVRMEIGTRLASERPGAVTQATTTRVDYVRHTWSRTVSQVKNPRAPVQVSCRLRHYLSRPMAPLKTDLAVSPSSIRAALACGGLKITGRGEVDGTPVIRMAGTLRLTKYPLAVDVSPATYLPVRLQFGDLRFDYRWLSPTPANLAKLTAHIPSNFRRVAAGR